MSRSRGRADLTFSMLRTGQVSAAGHGACDGKGRSAPSQLIPPAGRPAHSPDLEPERCRRGAGRLGRRPILAEPRRRPAGAISRSPDQHPQVALLRGTWADLVPLAAVVWNLLNVPRFRGCRYSEGSPVTADISSGNVIDSSGKIIDLTDADLLSAGIPYDLFKTLRREAPVFWSDAPADWPESWLAEVSGT